MKKWFCTVLALAMLLPWTGMSVHAEEPQGQEPAQVKLTEQQKKELTQLHKDLFKTKEAIIKKYIEFGVIPKEKGEKILSHLKEHADRLEKDGFKFQPHHPRFHKSNEEKQEQEDD